MADAKAPAEGGPKAAPKKKIKRNVPIGLIGSLALCTIFYLLVAAGAIGSIGAQPVIVNNTIVGNSAGGGGGIACGNDCSPQIANCIIAFNNSGFRGCASSLWTHWPTSGNFSGWKSARTFWLKGVQVIPPSDDTAISKLCLLPKKFPNATAVPSSPRLNR